MTTTRIEKDSLGEIELPANVLYGAQTQRALNNFKISGNTMPEEFIRALLLLKQAAAIANSQLNLISNEKGEAIAQAVIKLLTSEHFMVHFPVDIFQTGSGTSTNMNANEVLATLASQQLKTPINANDEVNFGQSSNDVIPSCIHISAALMLANKLLPALHYLKQAITTKAQSLEHIMKTGRTHLMDALPMPFSQALLAWAEQIEQNIVRLEALQPQLHTLAQGGTAIGSGLNCDAGFSPLFYQKLSQLTGLDFKPAHNLYSHISSQDIAVSLSGQLKTVAVSLMKISNDLRWMNSGPLSGLGEIELEALQPGSSIMPGKVNPVIPEATAMVAAQVIGNDAAITVAGQSGNFELNVMLPLIAKNLLNSLELLSNICPLLADKAISTFVVNEDKLQENLYRNPILVTALNPIIGYEKAAKIAKLAYQQKRPIIDVATEQTSLSYEELSQLLNPKHW